MLVDKKFEGNPKPYVVDLMNTIGDIDYVKGGEIYKHANCSCILVGSSADLTLLTGYEPGSVAFTAGFANLWQLDASGTWQSMTT